MINFTLSFVDSILSYIYFVCFFFLFFFHKLAVVITDGNQTKTGQYTRLTVASQGIKNKGVTVYAVGVGKAADMTELREIATAREYVFTSPSFKGLQNISSGLRDRLCLGKKIWKKENSYTRKLRNNSELQVRI